MCMWKEVVGIEEMKISKILIIVQVDVYYTVLSTFVSVFKFLLKHTSGFSLPPEFLF